MLHSFLFCGSLLGGAAESFISAIVSSSGFKLSINNGSRSFYSKFLLVSFFIHLVEADRGFGRSSVTKCFLVVFEGKEGRRGPRFPFSLHVKGCNVGDGMESILHGSYLSRSCSVDCLLGCVCGANDPIDVI